MPFGCGPLLLVLCATAVSAQDPHEILQRYVAARKANSKQVEQYAYTEDIAHFSYDKHGELKKEGTETNDVIFVEGLEYKKLVGRNGKPLPRKEQAKEEKKLKQTAEERRKQRRNGLFTRHADGATDDDLLTIFDNKFLGEEEVRGHKTWVIELTPKAGYRPANSHEKEALSFTAKLWIDQSEFVALRDVQSVVGTQIFVKPGTVITIEIDKLNDDVWLPVSMTFVYRMQIMKLINGTGRDEYAYSNYRKFDVQSTITADPVQ